MKTKKQNLTIKNLKALDVKSIKSKIKTPKLICTVLLVLLHVAPAFAQVTDVENQLGIWGDNIKTILNAVVGIFSIGGGFLIFIQYMQGNEQAQKNFIRFIIGLAIFGLVALIANIFLPGADNNVDWDV
ncbi:hypothetical protein A8C32_18175 [Flavivirga aquatica]|uniref:Conjugal transfer protein TrbC n=1 Tax=Flavivirga aquatica TaxID=1849968 RepID=A0A1E5T7K7_9FLAO|nr:hypothetical protein [Flavivirga aquatica]OEK07364.1 hypothetical protein A8C32_18175 [Flavivirga aquatica]